MSDDDHHSPLHTIIVPKEGDYEITSVTLTTSEGIELELTDRLDARPRGRSNTEIDFGKVRITGGDSS